VHKFKLDTQLEKDCYELGQLNGQHLLLLNNSLIPWLILVPETEVTEIYELDQDEQILLLENINHVSIFLQQHYYIDKLNIAAIGNIVSQLHIHVIGRSKTDCCWPDVVWGITEKTPYDEVELGEIRNQVIKWFGNRFIVS